MVGKYFVICCQLYPKFNFNLKFISIIKHVELAKAKNNKMKPVGTSWHKLFA